MTPRLGARGCLLVMEHVAGAGATPKESTRVWRKKRWAGTREGRRGRVLVKDGTGAVAAVAAAQVRNAAYREIMCLLETKGSSCKKSRPMPTYRYRAR